jgi:hypothetical protein
MIKKIQNIHTIRTASHRFTNGSVPIRNFYPTTKRTPQRTSMATAQAHDQNIFSDMPASGNDPVTFEIMPAYGVHNPLIRKTMNASTISTGAMRDAKHKGHISAVQKTKNDTPDIPYGFNVLKDKHQAQALLSALKKKYNCVSQ